MDEGGGGVYSSNLKFDVLPLLLLSEGVVEGGALCESRVREEDDDEDEEEEEDGSGDLRLREGE